MNKQFHVYKSSAGSGKTFTLVKEFLKLCFTKPPYYFSSILAITFTNKATYELKSRVLESLKELADAEKKKSTMGKVLSAELSMPTDEIQQKASLILSEIMHNYADFSISTIDYFSHKLVRTFAKDLRLPINFQVEIDLNRITEESIANLIEAVGSDQRLTAFLIDFVLFKVSEENSWQIEEDLKKFANDFIQDYNSPYLTALKNTDKDDFNRLYREAIHSVQNMRREFEEIKNAGMKLLKNKGLHYDDFANKKRGIGYYFYKINLDKVDSLDLGKNIEKALEQDKWYTPKTAGATQERIDQIKDEYTALIQKVQLLKTEQLPQYLSFKAILNNFYSLALINDIHRRIERFKKEERLLPISDFNKKIAEVVLKEPVPFIYVRLGERYNHLMIDEFQDTSVLQFLNLLPLIENGLAEGKMSMVVGDAKQAIYRFRGGEVRQLAEMPHFIPQHFEKNEFVKMRMQTIQQQYRELQLSTNYRSSEAVVSFNNKLFTFLSNCDLLEEQVRVIYKDYSQKMKPTAEGKGMVNLKFLESTALDEHIEHTLIAVSESLSAGYSPKDIAVICIKNKEATAVANVLKENNIPVVSSDALVINNMIQVRFLVSMARWIVDEKQVNAKREIINFFDHKEWLNGTLDQYYKKYLKGEERLNALFNELGIELNKSTLKLLPLHLLFEQIIRLFQLNESFDIYVQAFQEEVLAYSQEEGNNLNDFINWWDEKQDKISLDIPQGTDAVEVMTIHKSKGLDFPVIIVPFLRRRVNNPKGYMWVPNLSKNKTEIPYVLLDKSNRFLEQSTYSDAYNEALQKDQMDMLNVLYVAFTRAADRMYLISDPPFKKESATPSFLLQSFAEEENVEAIEEDDVIIYQWGRAEATDRSDISTTRDSFEVKYHSAAWGDKLKISNEAKDSWQIENKDAQRQYGTLLHGMLAEIKTVEEIGEILNKRIFQGDIDDNEKDILAKRLEEIVSHEALRPFFQARVNSKREASLLTAEGQILRPDLVVLLENKWKVIDYKTGEQNESHQQQMLAYMDALSKLTSLPVEGGVFYTQSLQMMPVA